MKILLITSEMDRGGAETHVYDLARALRQRGHRITVASAGGDMVHRLTAAGIRHVSIGWNTHSPFRLLAARRKWIRLLEGERFDLIHAHSRLPAFLVAGSVKKRGIPFVTTVHARFRVDSLLRLVSRWGDKTIAVSEDLARYAQMEYRLPSEQITVIPNGIDTELFRPADEKEDKLRVLFFSRLDEDCSHGAFLLCALAERLQERFPELEILIAGGGEMLPRLRREEEQLHCRNPTVRLRVIGHLSQAERLLPSVQAVVGVSRCALEAMSCGVPVILGGDEGFLGIAEGDVPARGRESNFCCRGERAMTEENLFSALCDLLSRPPSERSALGQALRAFVREHHGMERMARATEAVYRSALSESMGNQSEGVLLCGYYGYGNMGDEALLRAAILRARREFPRLSVYALTRKGKRDTSTFSVPCACRSSPLAVWRAVSRSSVLVFGGGTLLQDRTSVRSLAYYATLLRLGRRKGLKVLLWGNGLEAPHTDLGARLLRWALRGCDYLGLRDEPSVRVARAILGEEGNPMIQRESDLVLTYPPENRQSQQKIRERLGIPRDAEVAVIVPKGRGGRGVERLFCEWMATLRGDGITCVVVPMFPKEDGVLCRQLCTSLRGMLAEGLSASELIELMEQSRLVCGMRLHALVFAATAGTPFIGFGTDSKIEAFCRERGGVYFTDLYKKACR